MDRDPGRDWTPEECAAFERWQAKQELLRLDDDGAPPPAEPEPEWVDFDQVPV